jgi:hypothetical protein
MLQRFPKDIAAEDGLPFSFRSHHEICPDGGHWTVGLGVGYDLEFSIRFQNHVLLYLLLDTKINYRR